MTAFARCRQAINLVNLSTPLGCLLAVTNHRRLRKGPFGLLLAPGYSRSWPKAQAFTVGNVVLLRDADLDPVLLQHESRHASQYLACLGLPFLPLYCAGAAWSWWRCGEVGARNPFERWAGLAEGGYRERETIPRFVRLQERTARWRRAIRSR